MKINEYNEMMAYLMRPASLEEKLKEIDEKYPGSVKPANELPPVQDPFKDFEDRNPRETAAYGGRMGFYQGSLVTRGPNKGQYVVATREGDKTVQNYFSDESSMNKFLETKGSSSAINDPERLKDIKKYLKNFKKQNKRFPTLKETTIHFNNILGKDINQSIKLAAKEANIELPSGMGKNLKTKVDLDIKKLLNRKSIINTLESGKFPTESQIQVVLNSTRTKATTRQVDLARYLSGDVTPELKTDFKIPTKYKNVATTAIRNLELIKDEGQFSPRKTKTKVYNEKRLAKILGIDNFSKIRSDILKKIQSFIPELKGILGVDEIGSITAGARTNSPYTIFAQVLGKDFNQYTKSTGIDKSKSLLEKKLITLAKDSPERIKLLEEYNEKVNTFEKMANKDNPAKKVKAMKLSFEKPSKAIKNKKVYNQYKDLFDAHYEKYGYSFEVDKDTDSITDISKKLDNKSFQGVVKDRFKTLFSKGGKIGVLAGLGTLAGTGFALADDMTLNEEGLSTAEKTGIGAGVAGGAYAARKPILKTLGKIARPFGFPIVGAGFAAKELAKGKDANLGVAGADLLLPELIKKGASTGTGIMSKIGRVAANPFGKLARGFTPVGLGLMGIEGVRMGMREQDRINEMKLNEPEKYQEYLDELESYEDFSAWSEKSQDHHQNQGQHHRGWILTIILLRQ